MTSIIHQGLLSTLSVLFEQGLIQLNFYNFWLCKKGYQISYSKYNKSTFTDTSGCSFLIQGIHRQSSVKNL